MKQVPGIFNFSHKARNKKMLHELGKKRRGKDDLQSLSRCSSALDTLFHRSDAVWRRSIRADEVEVWASDSLAELVR